jgi:flagellar basal body L-ring protein FlgH
MYKNKNNNNDNNNHNKRDFVNSQQKKFYLISRAFKFGNILATIILISFIGKYFLG